MKLGLLLFFFSPLVFAQISLISAEYQGSGCPQGQVSVTMTPNGSAFSILYDAFDLRVDKNITVARASCRVVLHVKKPRKTGFRIENAEFRGFVALDAGVSASQNVKVMVGPNQGHQKLSAEFGSQIWQGPIAENYNLSAVRPVNKKPPVLDCVPPKENTDIVIDSQIQVTSAGGEFGQLTVDSVDGVLVQKFNVTWVNCGK